MAWSRSWSARPRGRSASCSAVSESWQARRSARGAEARPPVERRTLLRRSKRPAEPAGQASEERREGEASAPLQRSQLILSHPLEVAVDQQCGEEHRRETDQPDQRRDQPEHQQDEAGDACEGGEPDPAREVGVERRPRDLFDQPRIFLRQASLDLLEDALLVIGEWHRSYLRGPALRLYGPTH